MFWQSCFVPICLVSVCLCLWTELTAGDFRNSTEKFPTVGASGMLLVPGDAAGSVRSLRRMRAFALVKTC